MQDTWRRLRPPHEDYSRKLAQYGRVSWRCRWTLDFMFVVVDGKSREINKLHERLPKKYFSPGLTWQDSFILRPRASISGTSAIYHPISPFSQSLPPPGYPSDHQRSSPVTCDLQIIIHSIFYYFGCVQSSSW